MDSARKLISKALIAVIALSAISIPLDAISVHSSSNGIISIAHADITAVDSNRSDKSYAWDGDVDGSYKSAEDTRLANSGINKENSSLSQTGAKAFNVLADIFNVIIALLTFLTTPLIMLAGWLLSPDWTFGDIFGLRPVLHSLWVFMSNIVYVIFAFLLLAIAFMNIFGAGGETYKIKQALPKLIIGVLIVPFTWFIVSATLSIANILTISVIQLPLTTIQSVSPATAITGTSPGKSLVKALDKKTIPKCIIVDVSGKGPKECEGVAGSQNLEKAKKSNYIASSKCPDNCISIADLLSSSNGGPYNMLSAYAYGIFKIDKINQLSGTEISEGIVDGVADIFKKLGFGAIFFIMFAILLIALVFALFSRAMMLWMYAIFSPLFALGFVSGLMPGAFKDKIEKNMTIAKFISLAMVPVYVSAALSFGLTFLGVVMNMDTKLDQGGYVQINDKSKDTGVATFTFGNDANSVQLKTVGVFGQETVSTAFTTGESLIATVIVGFLALAILWMAVMAALSADDITKHAVEPIASFGKSIGELVTKLPQYAPIPIGGGKSMSMKSLQQVGTMPMQALQTKAGRDAGEFGKKFGGNVADPGTVARIETQLASNWIDQHEWPNILKDFRELVSKNGRDNSVVRDLEQKIANGIKSGHLSANELGGMSKDEVLDANGKINEQAFAKAIAANGTSRAPSQAEIDRYLNSRRPDNGYAPSATTVKRVELSDPNNLIGAKAENAPLEIRLKVDGSNKTISLDNQTVLASAPNSVRLRGDDKTKLKEVIEWMSPADAKERLKKIFDQTKVNIDDLYGEIMS